MNTNHEQYHEQNEQLQATPKLPEVSKVLNQSTIILGRNEQHFPDLFRCGGCNGVIEGQNGHADLVVMGVRGKAGTHWNVTMNVRPRLGSTCGDKLCSECKVQLVTQALGELWRPV